MSRHYHSFEIKQLDEKFEGSDIHTQRSVQVKFFNKAGRVLHIEVYGAPEKEQLVSFYKTHQRLSLNNLYLRNFSLPAILQEAGAGLMVNDFSAVNAFFDSDDLTDFSNVTFTGNVDVLNAHFAYGNTSFYKAVFKEGDVDFGNVNFGNGDVNYQFVEFGNGTINFENAIFGDGEVLFVNTHFGTGKVSFKNVYFGTGEVDFHFSKFEKGDISFDKAVFGGPRVDFRRVEFGDGKLDFTRTDFGNGEVNFEETEYGKGRKNFKRAIFGKAHVSFELAHFGEEEVTFENAEFDEGKLSFFKSTAGSLVFSHCQLNNYLDLRVEKCKLIDLSNTIVKDIIDIKPGFSKVAVDQLNITGMRNLGKIFIDWEGNHALNLVASQQDTTHAQKADQFRILKEDFNTSGRYDDEDKAYVEFKRYELLSYKETALEEGKRNKLLVHLRVFFQRLIFDRMGLYATNPARVFASMLIVYLAFSMIYFVLHSAGWGQIETGLNHPEPLSTFTMSLYYRAVTFFTIGYGDYFPYGAIRWVACAEGFCGVFMMSYFVVAFVRKILR
jgi:hypothetical protein